MLWRTPNRAAARPMHHTQRCARPRLDDRAAQRVRLPKLCPHAQRLLAPLGGGAADDAKEARQRLYVRGTCRSKARAHVGASGAGAAALHPADGEARRLPCTRCTHARGHHTRTRTRAHTRVIVVDRRGRRGLVALAAGRRGAAPLARRRRRLQRALVAQRGAPELPKQRVRVQLGALALLLAQHAANELRGGAGVGAALPGRGHAAGLLRGCLLGRRL